MDQNPLVLLDFDCTLIDMDSDDWVVEKLGAGPLFNSLKPQLPWNQMMDVIMGELYCRGWSIYHIEEVLRSVPIQPESISAIKAAYALGCELRIVSDANIFFIKTILDNYGLTQLFTGIHTNPSFVDDQARLRIGPFHPKSEPPHGCSLCPPNMCKGKVIDAIRRENPTKRIIYAGDGSGDFCPTLRLTSKDFVLPRRGFPLLKLMTQHILDVKASVHPWSTPREMEENLLKIITQSRVLMDVPPIEHYQYCGPCEEAQTYANLPSITNRGIRKLRAYYRETYGLL